MEWRGRGRHQKAVQRVVRFPVAMHLPGRWNIKGRGFPSTKMMHPIVSIHCIDLIRFFFLHAQFYDIIIIKNGICIYWNDQLFSRGVHMLVHWSIGLGLGLYMLKGLTWPDLTYLLHWCSACIFSNGQSIKAVWLLCNYNINWWSTISSWPEYARPNCTAQRILEI